VDINGQYIAVEFLQGLNSGEGASIALAVPNKADATVFSLGSAGALTYTASNTIFAASTLPSVPLSFVFFESNNPYSELTCSLDTADSLTCATMFDGDPEDTLTKFIFISVLGEYGLYMVAGPSTNGATLTAIPA
jgi:hypothetical protein